MAMPPVTPAVSRGAPAYPFRILYSLHLLHLPLVPASILSGSTLSLHVLDWSCSSWRYIADILEFLPKLYVPMTLLFLSHGSKSYSPSLGSTCAQVLSWACTMRIIMTTTCSVHMPYPLHSTWTDTHGQMYFRETIRYGACSHSSPIIYMYVTSALASALLCNLDIHVHVHVRYWQPLPIHKRPVVWMSRRHQGFIQDFLLGRETMRRSSPPPRKKGILETSEIAFQAYFDRKLVLTDLWLKNTYPLSKRGISACRLAVLSS